MEDHSIVEVHGNKSPDGWMSVREFAAAYGMAEQTAYRKCRSGEVPHARIGGRIWINRGTLEAYLVAQVIECA